MLYINEELHQIFEMLPIRNHHLANCIPWLHYLHSQSRHREPERRTTNGISLIAYPVHPYTFAASNQFSQFQKIIYAKFTLKDIKGRDNGYGGGVTGLHWTNSRSTALPINMIHRSSIQTMQRTHIQAIKRRRDQISALAVSGRVNRIVFSISRHIRSLGIYYVQDNNTLTSSMPVVFKFRHLVLLVLLLKEFPVNPLANCASKSQRIYNALDEVGLVRAGSVDRGSGNSIRRLLGAGSSIVGTAEEGSQPAHGKL